MRKVEIYKDQADEFRWRVVASNGAVLADSSEGYKNHLWVHEMVRSLLLPPFRLVDLVMDTDQNIPFTFNPNLILPEEVSIDE